MKTINLIDWFPSNAEVFLSGDTHEGNALISPHTIRKLKHKVKSTKNGYLALGGDQHEAITVTDKRFSIKVHRGLSVRIDAQRDSFIERFDDVGDKILYLLDGNHERFWKNIALPNQDVAKTFNSRYAGGVLAKVLFPGFRLLDWHGWGSINSRAGDALQRKTNECISLKRKLRLLPGDDCEVMASHHFHFIRLHPPQKNLQLITNPNNNKLIQEYTQPAKIWLDKNKGLYRISEEDKYYVCCGSMLRGYVEDVCGYVEERGYSATELGCIKLTIKNDKLYKVEEEFL